MCFLYNFTDWLTVVIGCFIIFAIMLNFTDYLFEMIINSIVRGRCKVDRNRLCNICKWTMNWISSHLECARALMLFLVKTWFWFGFLFIRCFWFPLRSMELCFEGGSFYAIIFFTFFKQRRRLMHFQIFKLLYRQNYINWILEPNMKSLRRLRAFNEYLVRWIRLNLTKCQ